MIAFDDEKTNLVEITGALGAGNFVVRGRPVYLQKFPADHHSR
jgi:hypothetical protein